MMANYEVAHARSSFIYNYCMEELPTNCVFTMGTAGVPGLNS